MNLRDLIPCSAKLPLYKSAILPYRTYSDIIFHSSLQERTLRAVFKSKTEIYRDLLERACMPSRYQTRLQNIAMHFDV